MTKRTSRPRRRIISAEEAEIQRQIASDPDDEDITDEQITQGKPFAEAFPELMESIKRARGRPRLEAPKQAVTLRLDPLTLAKFKATGKNWRARMAKILERARV